MDDWKLKPAADFGLPAHEQWRSLQRESGLAEKLLRIGWWTLVRVFLTCWNRLEVRGRERLPSEPRFVMIANYESHLDALVLVSGLSLRWRLYVSPIAAGDVFFTRNSVAAFSAICINALPIWRRKKRAGAHSMQTLRERLLDGASIYILFPEGTRCRDGNMLPFKSGLGALVVATSVPVVPCHLRGTFEAAPPGARFPRCRKIVLQIGRPMTFAATDNNRQGWEQSATMAEQAIHQLAGRGAKLEPDSAEGHE
jgi:1-acyl-sn-glycerol-3-phosphate acyltransferase